MPEEKFVTQLMGLWKWGANYLELLNKELCILDSERAVNENCHGLTLDNFPESYMLLISISSTPISFYQNLAVLGHG